ncbi:unnamed protein product [Brassicogethes aeneus]|uniref:Dynein axonemal assembly factor 1 homolog n=1 Tax=Brassicogethes aeneus TaxID=1431903 RepID=A0A9P0AWZ6_BRAAE|nr:unnamed protein product [Brassicogethes aeneus]
MPTSSSAATIEKKKPLRLQQTIKAPEHHEEKNLLKIQPALPNRVKRSFIRSHSTLNASSLAKGNDSFNLCDPVNLQTYTEGTVHVSRSQAEKEKNCDKISLDRRGLINFPVIDGEHRLRLLSLQHNLVNNLDGLRDQTFPFLVFLDVYDNQLEQISGLDGLENLRVLLMGKNRIKKIEGLEGLKKLEVLDLHGNQIVQISGLSSLTELKVLNLAGNQIKTVGTADFKDLTSLQELNLRRNKCKKLLGFGETTNLSKLFLSNNDLQSVEDFSSLARSTNLKEISIDNNPVFLNGECLSFLVSYLPLLVKVNTMQITDQVRKAAMAWRRNKELTNTAFMDLTSDVCLNVRREEVISNARTNWELLRSQTKCLTNNSFSAIDKTVRNLKPDSEFILTSLSKLTAKSGARPKHFTKVPALPDKKLNFARTASQDTENSQNTSSSNSNNELFKLPPILVPIIGKLDEKCEVGLRKCSSLSSIGPNVDSSASSLASSDNEEEGGCSSSSDGSSSSSASVEPQPVEEATFGTGKGEEKLAENPERAPKPVEKVETPSKNSTETSSNLSSKTSNSNASAKTKSSSSSDNTASSKTRTRNVKSAFVSKSSVGRCNVRAATAKVKKQSPPAPKDREQGSDYLIEICGRHLNVYGQGALRFVEKSWHAGKAHDVTTANFNYANFASVAGVLFKLKAKFPNVDSLSFKETNIACLGQLNALAEVQGVGSLTIHPEGNPICEKEWRSYAVYRLAHWGLKTVNGEEVTDEEIASANEEFRGLSDLVLWSLPDVLLQPLLERLRIDVNRGLTEDNAKKWLLTADPALRSVVSKEALQWKKGAPSQEDHQLRQKAKQHISFLLDDMNGAALKLKQLEPAWPDILHEFVRNTLLDYSQLEMYMKKKMHELVIQ